MGAAGQVAANHPGAGLLVEGFLASARVDPGATSASVVRSTVVRSRNYLVGGVMK